MSIKYLGTSHRSDLISKRFWRLNATSFQEKVEVLAIDQGGKADPGAMRNQNFIRFR